MISYTIEEHRHRFGLWAAARAAQRGLRGGDLDVLCAAIEKSGLPEIVRGNQANWPSDAAEFDALHRRWCGSICDEFLHLVGEPLAYGRAAKLVAVYLKSTVINAGFEDSEFAHVIHPPIDRFLLQELAKDRAFSVSDRRLWRSANWTKLDEESYFKVVESMRSAGLGKGSFWKIEQHWRAQG